MRMTLLILAAGVGRRYGGEKQVDGVGPNGETIMEYSIYDAIRAGFTKVIFIIRREMTQMFEERFGKKLREKIEVGYVYQELDDIPKRFKLPAERKKPWGTGHAILAARNSVKSPCAIINADDFYGASGFQLLYDYLQKAAEEECEIGNYAMVGFRLQNTLSDFGSVSRGVCYCNEKAFVEKIDEVTKIYKKKDKICYEDEKGEQLLKGNEIVSMNMWGFTPCIFRRLESLFQDFLEQNIENPKGEFYITEAVTKLIQKKTAQLKRLKTDEIWCGVTYQEDKKFVKNRLKKLTEQGIYPENLWKTLTSNL